MALWSVFRLVLPPPISRASLSVLLTRGPQTWIAARRRPLRLCRRLHGNRGPRGRQLGARGGWSWRSNQRARRPWRAMKKASSVIAETEMKNVINLRHPGWQRNSRRPLLSSHLAACFSTCFQLPRPLCSAGVGGNWGSPAGHERVSGLDSRLTCAEAARAVRQ